MTTKTILDKSMAGFKLLTGKTAVVFGAGGSIGSAVAKEFAKEGAEVFLAGRTRASLEATKTAIDSTGGCAQIQVLDAADDVSVNRYFDTIVRDTGKVDVVFNAIGPLAQEYGPGKLAVDLTIDEFMAPLTSIVKPNFVTSRAASRHMVKQGSGVIIFLTGSPARGHIPGGTSIGTAFGAIETLMENLAIEVGTAGVRAVCLRTTVNIDSRTIQDLIGSIAQASGASKDEVVLRLTNMNFLKREPSTSDTANAAAFLASDRARLFTGTVVNSTAGAALD